MAIQYTLQEDGTLIGEDGSGDKLVFGRLVDAESVAGAWTMTAAQVGETIYSDLSALGTTLNLQLNADGTGVIASESEKAACTWTQSGASVTVTQDGGAVTVFTLQDDGILAADAGGVTLILSRTEENPLTSAIADLMTGLLDSAQTQTHETTEAPVQDNVITSEYGYSMTLPEGWFPLNDETLTALIDLMGKETADAYGLNESLLDSFRSSNGAIYYSSDLSGNCNIIREDAHGLTMDAFPFLASSYQSTYANIGITDFTLTGPVEINGNAYYVGNYTIQQATQRQYFCIANNAIFTFTFTNVAQEDAEQMLGTFQAQ